MQNNATKKNHYRKKIESYENKYRCGYYTHIHTGIYDKQKFKLLHNEENLEKLGLEKIKHYLHWGQEALLHTISGSYPNLFSNNKYIIDCGAGHGGTSIYIADNYKANVIAITLSEEQEKIIKERVFLSGNEGYITTLVGDILDINFDNNNISSLVGIDSFSQIGSHNILFNKIYDFLDEGGVVAISDCFVSSHNTETEKFYNTYWNSRITTLQETLDAAFNSGFSVVSIQDYTEEQIPAWKLSIAHTNLLINKGDVRDSEAARLKESLEFHNYMRSAYKERKVFYYNLIIKK